MKFVVLFTACLFLSACGDTSDPENSSEESRQSFMGNRRKPKKLSVTGDGTPPKTAIHRASLVCRETGEDEFGVPQYDVYVQYDSTKHKVGSCNACAPLDLQDYHDYNIPKEAMAAVGGWFASSGDFFYIIATKDDGINVYAGWQNEKNMEEEEEDVTFHYKKVYEKHPDAEHKFF